MAKLRGARLVCFYCGKRSDTRYDNRLREFPCQNCEATNYLDSHGDITDPPIATTSSAPSQPARYAIPRATSPVPQAASSSGPSFSSSSSRPSSPSPSSEIFCARCLKNQELFTACLRQYEDSDDDDDDDDNDDDHKRTAGKSAGAGTDGRARKRPKDPARAQRKWFAYRRNIERLYPQVCAACEPRVLARVEQTRYTAKTDHLRRMMERSRTSRAAGLRRRTALDRADAAGWLAWWAGLALQLAWHVTCVLDAMAAVSAAGVTAAAAEDIRGDQGDGGGDGGGGGGGAAAVVRALTLLGPIRRILPPEERLGAWAIYAALLGVWWNPQFVQVCRGFVRHILGLRSWYIYQTIFLAGRLAARRFLEYDPARNMAGSTLITGHVMVAALTLLVYVLARRAVRVDTTPLFTDSSHVAGVAAAARQPRPPSGRVDSRPQTLSDVLDQVLASSPPGSLHAGSSSSGPHPPPPPPPPTGRLLSSHSSSTPLQPGLKYRGEGSPSVRLSGLSLGDGQQQQQYPAQQPQPQPAHGQAPTTPQRQQQRGPAGRDADEMDWSPIPAVPRAFSAATSSAPGNPSRPFSEAPTQPDHGPFWYKVPAAPVHPARQLRNPRPSAPRIIEKSQSSVPLFRSSGTAWGGAQPNGGNDGENRPGNVPFSEPTFFAPEEKSNDAANKLADMLSASFSLAQYDDGEDDDYRSGDDESSVPGAGRPKSGPLGAAAPASSLLLRHASTAQATLLAGLLAVWGWRVDPGRGRVAAPLGTLVAAGLIALWDVTSVVLGIRAASIASGVDRMIPPWRACLATTVHLAEIGLAAHIGRQVWDGEDGVDGGRAAGMGLLAEMAVVRLLEGVGVFGVGAGVR